MTIFQLHKLFMQKINTLMKTYTASINARANGTTRTVQTQIRALSASDARLLLQAIYGFHALASSPTQVRESIEQMEVMAPKTADQQRIENLKLAKKRANDALQGEKKRQGQQRALATLAKINRPIG